MGFQLTKSIPAEAFDYLIAKREETDRKTHTHTQRERERERERERC